MDNTRSKPLGKRNTATTLTMIREPLNIIEEELKIRKELKTILEARILNNNIHIQELEKELKQ